MNRWLTAAAAKWSRRAYRIVVQAYPREFRLEFGDAMVQAFGDLTRANKRLGLAGMSRLWLATLRDTAVSLVISYGREPSASPAGRVLVAALAFAAAVVVAVGYGGWRFHDFYGAPSFSHLGASGAADEDRLLAAYALAMMGDFGRFRAYLIGVGVALAVMLGAVAGLFSIAQRSVAHGAAALAIGASCTIAALSLLPTIWFPLDRYPAGFVWALGNVPIAAATAAVVAGSGALAERRRRISASPHS